jgi:hypothetical protein
MSTQHGRAEHIKAIRNALGTGLRESLDALDKYGSAEAAIAALKRPEDRDAFESQYDKLRRENAALRASRDELRGLVNEMFEMAENWPGIAYTADLVSRTSAALARAGA